jgi:hypothetical protein
LKPVTDLQDINYTAIFGNLRIPSKPQISGRLCPMELIRSLAESNIFGGEIDHRRMWVGTLFDMVIGGQWFLSVELTQWLPSQMAEN